MLPLVNCTPATVSLKVVMSSVPPDTTTLFALLIWLLACSTTEPPDTVRLPAIASCPAVLFRFNVPALTVVVPLYVFAPVPLKVTVPPVVLFTPTAPANTALAVPDCRS